VKIAIISSAHPEKCPYIKYYTDVLERLNLNFDLLSWNRDGFYKSFMKNNYYWFNYRSLETKNNLLKLFDYYKFSKFVSNNIKDTDYDILILYDTASVVFLWPLLCKKFKKKYIYDIRDYSPIIPCIRMFMHKIIVNSKFTVISSPGYKKWLPRNYEYIIGHNLRRKLLNIPMIIPCFFSNKVIKILTIGQIRNFSPNASLVEAVGNKSNILLEFVGYGNEYENLKKYSKKFHNILFTGRYKKDEEADIVKNVDFINILLPDTLSFNTPLSNRFYLSLIYRKPMIVNEESIQAKYVLKYKLGIVIKKGDNIYEKICEYVKTFDQNIFLWGCDTLLKEIKVDIDEFERVLIDALI